MSSFYEVNIFPVEADGWITIDEFSLVFMESPRKFHGPFCGFITAVASRACCICACVYVCVSVIIVLSYGALDEDRGVALGFSSARVSIGFWCNISA